MPGMTGSTGSADRADTGSTGAHDWEVATGWVGVALGMLALYAALAMLLEDVSKRTILPLARRRRGRISLQGGFTEQVEDLAHEPGVRAQL